jgi:hypothetical protein
VERDVAKRRYRQVRDIRAKPGEHKG